MTEAQLLQCAPVQAAHAQASAPGHRSRRAHRLGTRLWTLLHAPALLAGSVDGPGDAARIEDDRVRLAHRQARGPAGSKSVLGQYVLGPLGVGGSEARVDKECFPHVPSRPARHDLPLALTPCPPL